MQTATALDLQTRILIVDDDPGIRELMAAFLSGHGFLVDSAADSTAMRRPSPRATMR
ncbi:hypothetical protein [Sphingomonas sp.]|uniref:hypothetical protein n=1 Tax=Sphingomonas sp. TaxID=28214 RepID=UPI002ED83056